jgi:Tol biopolymer transport system component
LVNTATQAFDRIDIEPSGTTDAVISPDGTRIAFSVNTLGGVDSNDIWVVAARGGRAKRVTDQAFLQHFPVWSTSGEDLFYLSGRGGQTHDIWKVRVDGGAPSLVLGEHTYNFEPAISSKGDIAFSSNYDGGYDLFILEAGSSVPRRLTSDPAWEGQPTFSPDGTRIAFLSRRGKGGLRILDLSSAVESVFPADGEVRLPFWFGDKGPG